MLQYKQCKVVAFIPARYASERFPGKPLAQILGKSLIQRTYDSALRCPSLEKVIVATDDKRIYDHVKGFGGNVVMTSSSCKNGTERIVEAVKASQELNDVEIILNIQGDEPCVDPIVIESLIKCLQEDSSSVLSTPVAKIESLEEALSPSVVKCVLDMNGHALYFSRSLIPGSIKGAFRPDVNYYKHIGIYGFRKAFLLQYADLPVTPLQVAEDLEQLKVLEHGFKIKTVIVEHESIGVDLPEDIEKIERFLCKQNMYLSQEESAPPSEKG